MIKLLFWVYIAVIGLCEASFAYNGFTGGMMRWLVICLTVVSLCLFAWLDTTPTLRKAAVYIGAAVIWGLIRYGYSVVHNGLGQADAALAELLLWVDLAMNFAALYLLARAIKQRGQ